MKKILVPTDFSESAYAAAEVAASIAKKTGARVYLLHVVDLLEYGDEEEISKQLFVMKLVRKRMQEMVE
jgi:nucleotide-binding universal stress UspA family protein